MKVNKVFLAIRTDFFGDMVEDEHITLKYFNEVDFEYLLKYAKSMDAMVPTYVRLNGFANWTSDGMFYEVALIDTWADSPALYAGVRTPHITIRKSNKPLSCATFVPEFYSENIPLIDRLWIGKKIKGKIQWWQADSAFNGMTTLANNWKEVMA